MEDFDMLMTYEKLLAAILELSPSQRQMSVTIGQGKGSNMECFGVEAFTLACNDADIDEDVADAFDPSQPILLLE